jgi:hypothetical protein
MKGANRGVYVAVLARSRAKCDRRAVFRRRFPRATGSFGIFASERKARDSLVRLATRNRLCRCLLGRFGCAKQGCLACPIDQRGSACVDRVSRQRQLLRLFAAIKPSGTGTAQVLRYPRAVLSCTASISGKFLERRKRKRASRIAGRSAGQASRPSPTFPVREWPDARQLLTIFLQIGPVKLARR